MKRFFSVMLIAFLLEGCGNSQFDSPVALSTTPSSGSPTHYETPTSSAIANPTLTPTQPAATAATIIPTKSSVTIWDYNLPTPSGIDTFPELEVISLENVDHIEEIASWGIGHPTGISLSPDKNIIAVATMTGVYLYNRETLSLEETIDIGVLPNEAQNYFTKFMDSNIDFSPDGKTFAVGTDAIYVWNFQSNKLKAVIEQPGKFPVSIIQWVKYNQDGSRIIVVRNENVGHPGFIELRVEIYDAHTGDMLNSVFTRRFDGGFKIQLVAENTVYFTGWGQNYGINTVDGKQWVLRDEEIEITDTPYNIPSKDECDLSVKHKLLLNNMLDYSDDGMVAVTFGRFGSSYLNIWDLENCEKSGDSLFLPVYDSNLSFSLDGNYLIAKGFGDFYSILNMEDGLPIFPFRADTIPDSIDDSIFRELPPDDHPKVLDEILTVIKRINPEILETYNKVIGKYNCAISPDGKILAFLTVDGTVHILGVKKP